MATTTPEAQACVAAGLLHTLWLASPALPVGGFSYSEGLEAAVDAGLVHDEASAADWLPTSCSSRSRAATWRWWPRPFPPGARATWPASSR
jgi:hypothetical protein